MMGKTRIEELCYELYGSWNQHDSWQRYAMVRELRELMKRPKASGSDHFEDECDDDQTFDDKEEIHQVHETLTNPAPIEEDVSSDQSHIDEDLVETEVATDLNGIEDRAVENEANSKVISVIVKKDQIPPIQIPDSQKVDAETELPQHPVGGTIISHLSPLVPREQFQEDLIRMVDEVMGFATDDCFRGTQLFDPGGFNCIKDSGVLLFGSHQWEAQVRGVLADSLIFGVARESQPEVLHHIRTLLLLYTFSGVAQTRVESPNTNRVWKPGGPYCETDLGVEMFPCLAAFGVTLKQHFWYTIADIRMLNSQKKKWWIKEFAWFQKLHERKCFLQSIGLVEITNDLPVFSVTVDYASHLWHRWKTKASLEMRKLGGVLHDALHEEILVQYLYGGVLLWFYVHNSRKTQRVENNVAHEAVVVGPTMKQLLSILAKKTAMGVEPEQEWHETFIQDFGCVHHADTPGVVMMAVIVNTYKLKHKWRYKKEKCLANALMGEDQMLDQALGNTHSHISPSLNRIWEPGAFQFQIFFSNVHYLDLEVKVSRGGEICYRKTDMGLGWFMGLPKGKLGHA